MIVNLTDSRDAQARGWGRPCTAKLVTVEAAGIDLSIETRVADLIEYALKRTHAAGYALGGREDDWGFACRHILNDPSKPMSNHAWGLAVDLNAITNGYGTHGDFPSSIAHGVWNPLGFRWGGDYTGTKDPMHFEFMGTPDDADRLTDKLGRKQRSYRPPPYPGHPIRQGSQGHPVRMIQRALKVDVDGIFGADTAHAVRAFERSHHIKPDGVVGARLWKRLIR